MCGRDQELKEEFKWQQGESCQTESASGPLLSERFAQFLAQFAEGEDPEARIRLALAFMRTALSKWGVCRFKDFWEARRLCLPLFKEGVTLKARALLWAEYLALSSEARRASAALSAESAFASEQIELAVAALEQEIKRFAELLEQASPFVLPEGASALHGNRERLAALQSELGLLNTMAVRVHALRREVVKAEMQVDRKNRLLEGLAFCRERIFPRQRELIEEVSEVFRGDVERFVHTQFDAPSQPATPSCLLRDEIGLLQSVAKELTLDAEAFVEIRQQLGRAWELLHKRDREQGKKS